jgi:hypothetical protein
MCTWERKREEDMNEQKEHAKFSTSSKLTH